MKSILRDLIYLAREAVGVFTDGFQLGLKIARDEGLCRDEITHGPAWREAERPDAWRFVPLTDYWPTEAASTDGAGQVPAVECSPAAASEATSAAAGHPNIDADKVLSAAAIGLRQWVDGETCGAPTFYGWIARDLDELFK